MLLAQRLVECEDMTLKVLGKVYKNMKALEADMKTHPQNFNEDYEYSLIEPRPFMKVTWEQKAIVESKEFHIDIIKGK